jgi:class 3 adenylate cyclase
MESSSRTLVCSVLFLDIVEYSKKAVSDQLQLKQAFNQVLSKALEEVPTRDRIILDTGDGAAVTFMGDPEDALFAAMTMRDSAGPVPVRLGVNLGPVRLVKDLNGQMNIIGDGINVAQRVMSFSRPGQLLVSRSFYEVVSCLSRDYMNLFRHEGSRTDKHVREHEVYSVVGGAPASRRSQTASQPNAVATLGNWVGGTGPLGLRRTALLAAPALFLALVGGGATVSAMVDRSKEAAEATPAGAVAPAAKPQPLRNLASVPTSTPGDASAAPLKKIIEKRLAEKKREKVAVAKTDAGATVKTPAKAARTDPGRLELAIAPWGTVFVDGHERGASPPLRVLDISPGLHTIVIHNTDFPPHVERVVIKSGEATRIRHRFR